jgi:hypothetical protein
MLSSWFANTTLQKGRKIADELDSDEMMIGTAWLSDRPLPSELEYFFLHFYSLSLAFFTYAALESQALLKRMLI